MATASTDAVAFHISGLKPWIQDPVEARGGFASNRSLRRVRMPVV